MNRVHVIVNPQSAGGKTEGRWEVIKEIIKSHFQEFKYIFTEKPKQATDIARELLKGGFDLIIGVGGDGTLNEITNGFFKDQRDSTIINSEASLGIVPSGTGSDFIRAMKIPRDFQKSVKLIKDSKMRKIDVGKVAFSTSSQYFINVSDFGLGAEVIKRLSTIPAQKRGRLTYYRGLLSTIKNYHAKPIKITLNDNEVIEGRFLIGAVANGKIFGGGMIIAPEAEPDDGYFDVILIEDMKKIEIVTNSRHLYTGAILKNPKVRLRRAKSVRVNSTEEVNIECDGELSGTLPAEFTVIPGAVNFRV